MLVLNTPRTFIGELLLLYLLTDLISFVSIKLRFIALHYVFKIVYLS